MPVQPEPKPGDAPHGDAVGVQPTLVIKFRLALGIAFKPEAESELKRLHVGNWRRVQELAPGSTLRPSLWEPEIRLEDLKNLIELALKEDPNCEADQLLSYYVLHCPFGTNEPALLEEIQSWAPEVEEVYAPLRASDPVVNPSDDPYATAQGYLDAAPLGVDARDAWLHPGGDGRGQEVVDLEQGWKLDHPDLDAHFPNPAAALLFGTNMPGAVAHGTRTLGVICAEDNTEGVVGIAPWVSRVNVVSYSGRPTYIPKAILIGAFHLLHVTSFPKLRRGGVLVIEAQLDNPGGLISQLPCEADPLTRLCMRFASVLGVVVIEAAANGGGDLDTYVNSAGQPVFDRTNPVTFRDSGAIMVAAADFVSTNGGVGYALTRRLNSNFGSRIDCHAWGSVVTTTTFEVDSAGIVSLYTGNYNSTSSATAIIAGAALSIQGMAEVSKGAPFQPLKVREVVSEWPSPVFPVSNTVPYKGEKEKIGVMPNLLAIRQNHI